MMLTIHGLPMSVKYHDLKSLIKEKCNISDYILDNLVSEGDGTKKVRIGLADESEGSYLMKCLDGLRTGGNLLRVVPYGKPAPTNQNYDQRGFPPRNDYPPQSGPNYGRPEPMGHPGAMGHPSKDSWGSGGQWDQHQGSNQLHQPQMQQNYNNYPQHQGMNAPYQQPSNQQAPPSVRPDIRPQYDQRDQFPVRGGPPQNQPYRFPNNDAPDVMRRPDIRPHVLRSVEIVDEPLARPPAQARYPPYEQPHKPITIMKDNFQGPQYGADRPLAQPYGQGHAPQSHGGHMSQGHDGHPSQSHGGHPIQGHGGHLSQGHGGHPSQGHGGHPSQGHGGHPIQGHSTSTQPWSQSAQQMKVPYPKVSPNTFDRKYPNTDKMAKPTPAIRDPYAIDYPEKPGPRFSPRRDMDKSGPRFSPRRDIAEKAGPRFSPRRDILDKTGSRFSPRRDIPDKTGPRFSPRRDVPDKSGSRFSPRRDVLDKTGPRFSPRRDIIDKPGPRFSPRRDSSDRRMSPRRLSPGRRVSPDRISPGRHLSPGKRISPSRRMSPEGRHDSAPRRAGSPRHKRMDTPGRYSPRRGLDKAGKFSPERPLAKDVRPAYDTQAANQAMYAGGYRPSLHENVQYPIPGARQPERAPVWDKPGFSKKDEARMPKFEPRNEESKRSRSPPKSRSPSRRDRSPPRERFRKHSPSPRSPRRSWALEKRRSPETREPPPPPVWPGQSRDEESYRRFGEDNKHVPVWEPRRPEEDRFAGGGGIRVRTDLESRSQRDPSPRGYKEDRFASREPKFEPRDPKFEKREPKFEARDPKFEARNPKFETRDLKLEARDPKYEARDSKYEARDPKYEARDSKFETRAHKFEPREEFRRDDTQKRYERDFRETRRDLDREDFHREEERQIPKGTETFNKEFEDVYKRALALNKRAEELRKRSLERRRDELDVRDTKEFDRKFNRRDDKPEVTERRDRDPEWKTKERKSESPTLKAKREKAIDELAGKILDKHAPTMTGDVKKRVTEEMRLVIGKALHEMFGYLDVSFIEMVVKFNAKYDAKAEKRMFEDVMSSMPSHFRNLKRPANEPIKPSDMSQKHPRLEDTGNKGDIQAQGNSTYVPDWQPNPVSPKPQMVALPPPTLHIPNPMLMPQYDMMQQMSMMVQQPVMVPAPAYPMLSYEEANIPSQTNTFQAQEYPDNSPKDDGVYNLYLCKDDFEPYSDNQADYLKRFLIAQLVSASQSGQGWSPDFTLKGLQSAYRYEVETRDEGTKNWLLELDFSEFQLFNVLVYTKEELWYERAAVWLPGHSRCRNIDPMTKLRLQNRQLDGVNIGKWKFVKKIITLKGTRIYVDMPPSSARALEKHKMLLSYELQKVSVFLKAIAVDKEVFDSGLRVPSITDQAEILSAANNSPMPSLAHDPNIIKICLKGNKALSVPQARKIKDMVIYHIFKYHQANPNSLLKTDFVKFGFCLPGYFGLLPENNESKRWLMSLNIGKLNKHAVVVLGADEASTKYIQMGVILRKDSRNMPLILERLKQSNQGVKGLNFSLWKPISILSRRDRNDQPKIIFEINMDIESVETIMNKLHYRLDYVDDRHSYTLSVKYAHSDKSLRELVKKLKSELDDSYDVANMDIASSEEDDDLVCTGDFN